MADEKQDAAKEARTNYEAGSYDETIQAGDLQEQYVIDREGKKVGVILPFEQYQQMKEDLHDLAVVAERREEASVSLEEMKQRLKDNGLL
jgi:PHD/YefM family antitoxin component YafN of YafNO toxin-antitoxin module